MAADKLKYAIGNSSSTTLSGSVANDDTTMTITSDTNFAAKEGEGMIIVDEGTATEEFAYSTGKTGTTLTTPLANRGLEGGEAKAHDANATVKGIITATMWNDVIDSLANVVSKTTGALDTTKTVDLTTAQTLTNKTIGTTNLISFNSPEGFLLNGKIVPSVADNNLTVALKGLDGNDPSATNPIYCRIGDTVRSITSALSIVSAAGTNYLNLGSAETATNGTDLFVYLGINATDDAPILLVSRVPYFSVYSQFASGNTAANSTLYSTAPIGATSNVVNIGRFSATLSAGAGYTWSVPTFTTANLIQRPIFETSKMDYKPTVTGFSGTPTANAAYQLVGRRQYVFVSQVTGTSNATGFTISYPNIYGDGSGYKFFFGNDNSSLGIRTMEIGSTGTLTLWPTTAVGNWTASGTKSIAGCHITIRE